MFLVCFHSCYNFLFLKFAPLASVNSDFSHPFRASYFKPKMTVWFFHLSIQCSTRLEFSHGNLESSRKYLNLEMVSMELTGKAHPPSSVSDVWPYNGKRLVLEEEVV